jgi:hypothetical protein
MVSLKLQLHGWPPTKPLPIGNLPDDIKRIKLKPLAEVKRHIPVREFTQSLEKDICALIHEFLIRH